MYISHFKIVNFKLFQNIEIDFNQTISIITGVNNAGKTTILQALSLWHECFNLLIREAGKSSKNYKKNDFILGNTQEKYFSFNQIHSVLIPNFEDIFYQRDTKSKINLSAIISSEDQESIEICFLIGGSGKNYTIELFNFRDFDFHKFNTFFKRLPSPFNFFYTSPSTVINQFEKFTTFPQINEAIINRDSASVIRNRLYLLYNSRSSFLFSGFLDDLSFILYNNQRRIIISTSSDIQKNSRVIFTFKHDDKDIEKDIALLGSGTLQIIEILLNLYNSNLDVLNLILLDEPDSHIHRDIQSRLLRVLTSFFARNQIFLTTHNEALIRSADPSQLFHLDGNPTGHYQSLINANLTDVPPRFSGLYPSQINPIISALGGDVNGLDFLNAIESDKLMLVEGADDAKAFNILLKRRIGVGNIHKKYVYWVLGGISEVFERLPHYKTIFSAIKNQQTLWEKSVLIIDRDFLNDDHQAGLAGNFETRMNLKANVWSSYTFESTLFTDIPKLSKLLNKWLIKKQINSDLATIQSNLQNFYDNQELQNRYTNEKYEQIQFAYMNYKEKLNNLFGNNYISQNHPQLSTIVRTHINSCITSGEFFKLMTKDDVMQVIYSTLENYGIDLKPSFIELIELVDGSTWFEAWNFLNSI